MKLSKLIVAASLTAFAFTAPACDDKKEDAKKEDAKKDDKKDNKKIKALENKVAALHSQLNKRGGLRS